MSNRTENEICEICGGKAQIKYVTRSYGKGANLLVIENVPVISCANCGESYLTAETLHAHCADKIASEKFCEKARCGSGGICLIL